MDFMTSPMFDILKFKLEKLRCPRTKALGIHVYLATIKDSYCLNGKYLEANAKAIHVLKATLNDEYLSKVSNLDSVFIVWNTIVSLGEQSNTMRGATRMMEVMLSTYATRSKGTTSLR